DVADLSTVVATPKIEAARHHGWLAFSFRKKDAIQADQQTLLGDLGEVDIDGSALRDGGCGGNVLSHLHSEARRVSAKRGRGDGLDRGNAVGIGVSANCDVDIVQGSRRGFIRGL